MRMGVRDVAAGEQERDTLHLKEPLHGDSQPLPQVYDLRGQFRGQIVEVSMMLARHDLDVPRPDRIDIEERMDALVR